jgi:hypothetical protein
MPRSSPQRVTCRATTDHACSRDNSDAGACAGTCEAVWRERGRMSILGQPIVVALSTRPMRPRREFAAMLAYAVLLTGPAHGRVRPPTRHHPRYNCNPTCPDLRGRTPTTPSAPQPRSMQIGRVDSGARFDARDNHSVGQPAARPCGRSVDVSVAIRAAQDRDRRTRPRALRHSSAGRIAARAAAAWHLGPQVPKILDTLPQRRSRGPPRGLPRTARHLRAVGSAGPRGFLARSARSGRRGPAAT